MFWTGLAAYCGVAYLGMLWGSYYLGRYWESLDWNNLDHMVAMILAILCAPISWIPLVFMMRLHAGEQARVRDAEQAKKYRERMDSLDRLLETAGAEDVEAYFKAAAEEERNKSE